MNLFDVFNSIKPIVLKIGEYQKEKFRSDLNIDTKSNITDLVTEVDKYSEKTLVEELEKLYPDFDVLGEEGANKDTNHEYKWIIDPLDGTNNYANGIPTFSISVALQKNKETVLGIVYAPYLNEFYHAIKGHGSFLNDKKILVGNKDALNQCILVTGFPYDKKTQTKELNNLNYFSNIMPEVRGIRRFGSAAYDICMVAAGFFDGYWEMNLNLWDVAAGFLILEEAGGLIDYFREDRNISVVVGNEKVVKLIKEKLI